MGGGGAGGGGAFSNTLGARNKISVNSKADALSLTKSLPQSIQRSAKNFFKGGSSKYDSFSVEQKSNGNYMIKMEKPGDVPGSKAIYYKEVDSDGNTIRVYKETYGPDGKLIHTKEK